MYEQGMRRKDGSFETILNVQNARKVGEIQKDGFTGDVWLAEEFYAFSAAVFPRVLLTGPAAGRVVADDEGFIRQCWTSNDDRFKGAVVLTIEDADMLGIYTHQRIPLTFTPIQE